MKHPRWIIVAIAMLMYIPTLFFTWVYLDDYLLVQESGFYSEFKNIGGAFLRSVWHPTGSEYNYYRPASISVYVLGASISRLLHDDVRPWIFHLTNVILQGVVGALVFTALQCLGASVRTSGWGALFLVVLPASAGTVAWISGQNELLLAVWMLGGLISLVRPAPLVHSACLLMGLLTKENAASLPIFCLLYAGLTGRRERLHHFIGAWIAAFGIWIFMVKAFGGSTPPNLPNAVTGMIHGAPYLLIFLGRLLAPFGLETLPTPQDTALWIWAAGVLGAAGWVLAAWRWRRNHPEIFLGAAWFGGFLLPTFANMPVEFKDSFILRSDRAYVASLGLLIAGSRLNVRHQKVLAGLVLMLAGLNVMHQFDFADGKRFYQSAVAGSPRSAFAHTHLGDMFVADKDYARAIEQYRQAISLNRFEPQAHNNLGVAYLRQGEAGKAAEAFRAELAFNPTNILGWHNLGAIHLNRGEHDEAEKAFRRAVEINPAYRDAWEGLVRIYTFRRDEARREEAQRALEKAEIDMRRGI